MHNRVLNCRDICGCDPDIIKHCDLTVVCDRDRDRDRPGRFPPSDHARKWEQEWLCRATRASAREEASMLRAGQEQRSMQVRMVFPFHEL
jgi:hypothetical protein